LILEAYCMEISKEGRRYRKCIAANQLIVLPYTLEEYNWGPANARQFYGHVLGSSAHSVRNPIERAYYEDCAEPASLVFSPQPLQNHLKERS